MTSDEVSITFDEPIPCLPAEKSETFDIFSSLPRNVLTYILGNVNKFILFSHICQCLDITELVKFRELSSELNLFVDTTDLLWKLQFSATFPEKYQFLSYKQVNWPSEFKKEWKDLQSWDTSYEGVTYSNKNRTAIHKQGIRYTPLVASFGNGQHFMIDNKRVQKRSTLLGSHSSQLFDNLCWCLQQIG
jgi:hypothetical protein